jgi:membrane peptidoglycan carboxypeptidase
VLEENLPQTLTDAQMLKLPPTTPDPVIAPDPSASPVPTTPTAETSSKLKLSSMPPVNDPDWVLDPRVAYVMTHLMKEVVEYGTGQKAKGAAPAAGYGERVKTLTDKYRKDGLSLEDAIARASKEAKSAA